MFIGHFAVGLAAKKMLPSVNLGATFLACQLLDLIWPVLVLSGIESAQVEPGATAFTPLVFHYPFSHSLVMAVVWAGVFGGIFFVGTRNLRLAAILAAVVLSHWVLDFLTHRPDLPIFLEGPKVGLGLWDFPLATVLIEGAMFGVGVFWYARATERKSRTAKMLFWSLIGFLMVIYAITAMGAAPPVDAPPAAIAGPALAMWIFVIWAYFADLKASVRNAAPA